MSQTCTIVFTPVALATLATGSAGPLILRGASVDTATTSVSASISTVLTMPKVG